MKLLDELRAEHELIEPVVCSLQTYVALRVAGEAPAEDGADYLRFFRTYADRHHHFREEKILVPALVATELTTDRGPLASLLRAHGALGHLVDEVGASLVLPDLGGEAGKLLVARARRYAEALIHHIDSENSVLFPESEIRFRRASVRELDDPPSGAEALSAFSAGQRLLERYPATELPGFLRGDGCNACPDYTERCQGIEREWWSDLEWADLRARMVGD